MICFTIRRGIGLRGGRWSFRKAHCVRARSGEEFVGILLLFVRCL